MDEEHVVMSDEEERTAGALFKIWEKQFRRSRRRRYPTRLPFPVTCGVDKLDAFATLVSQTLRVLVRTRMSNV